ncbi:MULTISPECIES: sulfate ABC transporter substrate-binding protein [unclassified Anabaena]|uniref:sulfate ABC transporter substrate-binding protein n=1 Tax=unclassified Anabaena TaxID=2619674 RepID=UPI000829FB7E|nr:MULTISPECIES: sulfate ABC transporter substrate-binding protein [unclassified Anabaena]
MRVWQRLLKQLQLIARQRRHPFSLNTLTGFVSVMIVGAMLSVTLAACSGGNQTATSGDTPTANTVAANKPNVELTLLSFAVTKAAHEAIIPKFVEKWKQEHNQTVTFRQSYGASGSQTRAVIDGLEADVVHLALALDTQKIEKAGLIAPGWEKEVPNNGIVSKSVAAIITRPGNPKGIKDWADLTKDNVTLITADPKTSGVARWNFLALWNAGMKIGGDEAKAKEFVTQVYSNVPILSRDAREAIDAFAKQGQGDALINYENEVILAQQKGKNLDYIVPEVNISIDNPIAVVDKNVDKHGNREVAEAFVKFLYTPEAQQEFVKLGFRPVNETVAQTKEVTDKFPKVKTLGTADDLGGWQAIDQKFFVDGGVFDQIQTSIRR